MFLHHYIGFLGQTKLYVLQLQQLSEVFVIK